MILLNEITIKNFLSHEDTQIKFNETEKILLDGRSGSGKSSITEAIIWVLYGKGRSDNRSLVRRGSKSASVSIKFSMGDVQTIITRSVSLAGKNTLTVTQNTGGQGQFLPIGRVGIKDTQDWIEKDFLKASYELFTNSVAYPQENENSFVKSNASKRKDLLLEIVRAGDFTELYEKTRDIINVNKLDNAGALIRIEALECSVKINQETANLHDHYKEINEKTTEELNSFVLTEKELEKKLNNISSIGTQLAEAKRMKIKFTDAIIDIDIQLDFDQKQLQEHNKIDIETARKEIEEIETLTKEVIEIENSLKENSLIQQRVNALLANKPSVHNYDQEIDEINRRLIPLIKETGKCPAGDACPFVIPINGQIQFLTDQITDKESKSKKEQMALIEWDKDFALIPPTKDTTESYKRLQDIKSKINILSSSKEMILRYEVFAKTMQDIYTKADRLNKSKMDYNLEILSTEKLIKELEELLILQDPNKINIDLSNIRNTIEKLRKTKEEAAIGVSLALSAIETVKTATASLQSLKQGVKQAQENEESLELLKEALSPRGIKAVVIDYLVPQLEERINNILEQMSDFRIRLDTQKATADEEGVKEGLFITVINDLREELSFSNYSGGEKVKITIAISEALASLMNQIGFRIMDENIISLDKESTEGFVIVLEKLQEKFPQLLVISHLQEVKDIFEKQIKIIKTNGVSKII
jgi:exonuclease SbcC